MIMSHDHIKGLLPGATAFKPKVVGETKHQPYQRKPVAVGTVNPKRATPKYHLPDHLAATGGL